MISDCRYTNDNKTLWINTGGNNSLSILLEEELHDSFFKDLELKTLKIYQESIYW